MCIFLLWIVSNDQRIERSQRNINCARIDPHLPRPINLYNSKYDLFFVVVVEKFKEIIKFMLI